MERKFNRVVVTGGAGFLGSHLCEALLARGSAVLCIDNLCTGSQQNLRRLQHNPEFTWWERDISHDPVPEVPAELVVHMASPASPQHYSRLPLETLQTGSTGTQRALELADRAGARFLLVSTSEVYGDPLVHPQTETYWGNVNPVGPRAVYDEAKRYAEALVTAYQDSKGMPTRIARVFNTYGPHMRADDGRMVPNFITQALRGDPITIAGDGEQTRSLCYVTDTVRGLLAVASGEHPGPVNIGNPEEIPVRRLAELIRRMTSSSSVLKHVPAAPDDPHRRCPDISLAQRELGWSPAVGMEHGLRRTIEWFTADTGALPAGTTSRS